MNSAMYVNTTANMPFGGWARCLRRINLNLAQDEVARMAGTIPYEIFTSINKRVQRVYSDKD